MTVNQILSGASGPKPHDIQSAWMYLHGRGCTFVRCTDDKRPVDKDWPNKTVSMPAINAHLNEGGLIGIVPGTLGWWVMDQDVGALDTVANAVHHIAFTLPSAKPGRGHHWLRRKARGPKNREIGNSNWKYNDCSGEIRGDKGFVIVWDIMELTTCLKQHAKASRCDPCDIPFTKGAKIPGTVVTLKPRPNKNKPPSSFADYVQDQIRQMKTCEEGSRNEFLNASVYGVYKRGLGGTHFDAEMTEAAVTAGLSPEESLTTIASAKKAGVTDAITEKNITPDKVMAALEKANRPQQSDAEFYPNRSIMTIEKALLDMGYHFRFNTLTGRVESHYPDEGWKDVTNNTATMRWRLETRCMVNTSKGAVPFQIAKERIGDLMDRYADDESMHVNPLIAWARTLPAWDRTRRLSNVFQETLAADDCLLSRWAGPYLFAGALIRSACGKLEDAGYSLDQMLFLVGPQGIGKSRFLKCALPPKTMKHWVCNDFDMNANHKDKIEKIIGKIFVEVPEITFDKFFSVDELKAFLSVTHDETRLPYLRRTEVYPRTATFVATVNHQEGLPDDPTGNRRFVPIHCVGKPPTGPTTGAGWRVTRWWNDNRDQVWAEAWELAQQVMAGDATLEMTPETSNYLAMRYEDTRMLDHGMDSALPRACVLAMRSLCQEYAHNREALPDGLRFQDIKDELSTNLQNERSIDRRMQTELRRMGWVAKRIRLKHYGSVQVRAWVPPHHWFCTQVESFFGGS